MMGSVCLDTPQPQQLFLKWTPPSNSSGHRGTTGSRTLDTWRGSSLFDQGAPDGMRQSSLRSRGAWEDCFSGPVLCGICQVELEVRVGLCALGRVCLLRPGLPPGAVLFLSIIETTGWPPFQFYHSFCPLSSESSSKGLRAKNAP